MPAAPVILRLLHPVSRPPPFQLFTSFNICPPSIHPSIWPTCSWARGRVTTASAAFFLNPEDKPSRPAAGGEQEEEWFENSGSDASFSSCRLVQSFSLPTLLKSLPLPWFKPPLSLCLGCCCCCWQQSVTPQSVSQVSQLTLERRS